MHSTSCVGSVRKICKTYIVRKILVASRSDRHRTMNENVENVTPESFYALLVAFETMKERCQRLQTRLAVVEKENIRLKCGRDASTAMKTDNSSDESTLQEKIEELTKQKSQLSDHVFMVAAENRQLWNRLTRLTKTNKSLGSQLTKISDTLKQHPATQSSDITSYNFCDMFSSDKSGEKESLEEISLRLINSIMLEKSNLEQQYAEVKE